MFARYKSFWSPRKSIKVGTQHVQKHQYRYIRWTVKSKTKKQREIPNPIPTTTSEPRSKAPTRKPCRARQSYPRLRDARGTWLPVLTLKSTRPHYVIPIDSRLPVRLDRICPGLCSKVRGLSSQWLWQLQWFCGKPIAIIIARNNQKAFLNAIRIIFRKS